MQATNFFKVSAVAIFLVAVFVAGCKKGNVVGPDNANNQVSFQLSQQNGYTGGVEFLFKSSADVKISQIVSMLPAQQFTDTIRTNDVNYLYSKDTTYIIGEYNGVQNGQQWKFEFTGSVPGQNNSKYQVTSDYTVQ